MHDILRTGNVLSRSTYNDHRSSVWIELVRLFLMYLDVGMKPLGPVCVSSVLFI